MRSRYHDVDDIVQGLPVQLTSLRRIRILSLSTAFWSPKSERLTAGTCEIASDNKKFPLAGIIPGLMVGSAYKGSLSYRRSAGLRTPSGPRLSPWA